MADKGICSTLFHHCRADASQGFARCARASSRLLLRLVMWQLVQVTASPCSALTGVDWHTGIEPTATVILSAGSKSTSLLLGFGPAGVLVTYKLSTGPLSPTVCLDTPFLGQNCEARECTSAEFCTANGIQGLRRRSDRRGPRIYGSRLAFQGDKVAIGIHFGMYAWAAESLVVLGGRVAVVKVS